MEAVILFVVVFLIAKISHGQLESKDFILGVEKKGMRENSILLCSLAFILKGIKKRNRKWCQLCEECCV